MLDMISFYDAWEYLDNHAIFIDSDCVQHFKQCLDIEVVKINPETKSMDDNETLNTAVQIWLEAGPYLGRYNAHDIDLDCGADTFEEAIVELASLVKQKYGDDRESSLKIVNKEHGNIAEE